MTKSQHPSQLIKMHSRHKEIIDDIMKRHLPIPGVSIEMRFDVPMRGGSGRSVGEQIMIMTMMTTVMMMTDAKLVEDMMIEREVVDMKTMIDTISEVEETMIVGRCALLPLTEADIIMIADIATTTTIVM